MISQARRHAGISELIRMAKATVGEELTRDNLRVVSRALVTLANCQEYWNPQEFPAPHIDHQTRYVLHEEPDGTYALYLNVMKKGKKSKPHDHTTWACIAGISGIETNFLYERKDGGTGEGHARLVHTETVELGPGVGLALMPRDIHSISISRDEEVRHLHFYGRAVELLIDRLEYDLVESSCRRRPVGVKTLRV